MHRLVGWCLLFCIIVQTTFASSQFKEHVRFLSSDTLKGRFTGSKGERIATEYIAYLFQKAGLQPAGDNGTYFQEFDFTAGVVLGTRNALVVSSMDGNVKKQDLGMQWQPLAFSANNSFEIKELVFAGYGISAPAKGNLLAYDSYYGLAVKDRWVVVFRHLPATMSAEQTHYLRQYSSARYKAFTAKVHGAKGILFVSDSQADDDLIPLSYAASSTNAGIIALSVKRRVINDLLKNTNLDQLQKKMQPVVIIGFKLLGQTDIDKKTRKGRNVLGRLKVTPQAKQMLIVGAHVDHLGRGKHHGSRARAQETGMIHPGADDNASGVACVLETARSLSSLQARGVLEGDKDILFAAWSGEELGTLGSEYFVSRMMQTTNSKSLAPGIAAVLNLDMVGHLKKHLVLQGVGSSPDWLRIIQQVNTQYSMPIVTQNDPYLPTDTTPFYLREVPVVNFFTGAHDDYHTPRDRAVTLNYAGLKMITDFLQGVIIALEAESKSIIYHKVEKNTHGSERVFKIYLGTIPDYTASDISGVRISGVAKNSPAERAGIQSHDVLVELAGNKIHDIYDYTFILNKLEIGRSVKLLIKRDTHYKILKITAALRD